MATVDVLGDENYISLTTFKRNGTGVATPVWVARDGGSLVVITESGSGKAKRLRNFARVMVAPCDMRGRVEGPSHDGTAELLDEQGTKRVQELITAKYGWQARLFSGLAVVQRQWGRLRRKPPTGDRVGIRITLAN